MPIKCKVKSEPEELILFVHGYGKLVVDDINSFKSFFRPHLNGEDPFKVFFDLRGVEKAPMKVISSIATYISSFENIADRKVVASTVLIDGKSAGLLDTLFKLKKPVTPTKVTNDIQEACDFLNDFECIIERELTIKC